MLIGYSRISTHEQTAAMQRDELTKAGAQKIFHDTGSGTKKDRPQFLKLMDQLRAGDTLIVWRLDRLTRSLKELIKIAETLKEQKVNLVSLTENIDTTTATGNLIFQIFGVFAEFERNVIIERTQAGLQAARARGRQGGRPKIIAQKKRLQTIKFLYDSNQLSIKEICDSCKISKSTFYRYLKEETARQEKQKKINEDFKSKRLK